MKWVLKEEILAELQSGLQHKAHIYEENNELWTANVCFSDEKTGENSFYKLQLLQSENTDRHWLFRYWGRIGNTLGELEIKPYNTLNDAKQEFQYLFSQKTGHFWEHRKHFMKVYEGLKVLVETDYNMEKTNVLNLNDISSMPCKLPGPIQRLMHLLFNETSIITVLRQLGLDLQKTPLEKLNESQLNQAKLALKELEDILTIPDVDENCKREIINAYTNKFYSLIPHDFGTKTPPIINSKKILQEKILMVKNLSDIKIAYNLIDVEKSENSTLHPFDTHYLKLNCTIDVLNSEMKEFSIIEQYAEKQHAVSSTYKQYNIKITDIFKLRRTVEEERFKSLKNLHNRKLLWHGSATRNFAAILSKGLQIAPEGSISSGHLYGKGIYFTDVVSNAAYFCRPSQSNNNNTGLLLLCEVALGNMVERKIKKKILKLPRGKQSCFVIGKIQPDPAKSLFIEDNLEVPLGDLVSPNIDHRIILTYPYFNEFIVFDISQVKLRYLIKAKFDLIQ